MSTRPRFAADGVIRLPAEVALEGRDEPRIGGTIGSKTYDPFARVGSDLLLAGSSRAST